MLVYKQNRESRYEHLLRSVEVHPQHGRDTVTLPLTQLRSIRDFRDKTLATNIADRTYYEGPKVTVYVHLAFQRALHTRATP